MEKRRKLRHILLFEGICSCRTGANATMRVRKKRELKIVIGPLVGLEFQFSP